MSVRRYKVELTASAEIIREARLNLKKIPKSRRIELLVEAGLLTPKQGERAIKNLAEAETAKPKPRPRKSD